MWDSSESDCSVPDNEKKIVAGSYDVHGFHDCAHGESHEHMHSHSHTPFAALETQSTEQPKRSVSVLNSMSTNSEISSGAVVLTMLKSTWEKGGATPVLVCFLLMVVTKLVKVMNYAFVTDFVVEMFH